MVCLGVESTPPLEQCVMPPPRPPLPSNTTISTCRKWVWSLVVASKNKNINTCRSLPKTSVLPVRLRTKKKNKTTTTWPRGERMVPERSAAFTQQAPPQLPGFQGTCLVCFARSNCSWCWPSCTNTMRFRSAKVFKASSSNGRQTRTDRDDGRTSMNMTKRHLKIGDGPFSNSQFVEILRMPYCNRCILARMNLKSRYWSLGVSYPSRIRSKSFANPFVPSAEQ